MKTARLMLNPTVRFFLKELSLLCVFYLPLIYTDYTHSLKLPENRRLTSREISFAVTARPRLSNRS